MQQGAATRLIKWLYRCIRLVVVGILIGWLSFTAVSAAEELPPEAPPPAEASSSRSGIDADAISSEKISQFVRVYVQVVNLIDRREAALQGAETASESQQIQQETEAEALALIQAAGLTIQEYLQLLGLANIDPEFGERVAAQLQESS